MAPKQKGTSKGISSWPEDERPRERLLSRGPNALTNAELLAILLRVGVRGKSAVELGRELLERFGSLQAMMSAPLSAWHGFKGLGQAKLAQLVAALELARRAALPASGESTVIKSTQQAMEYFKVRLCGLAEEHFRVAYLNRQGRLLEDALIAEGTVDSVRPPVRSILARALQTNSSALIAAHNHPSAPPSPASPIGS
jgi:DNA repair protein RadC